uniref:Chaperonin containing TCP1 subunit 8 n=1 Tax=Hucho hucho TaxID=62062 RepID=A0A4W5LV34_9TELE
CKIMNNPLSVKRMTVMTFSHEKGRLNFAPDTRFIRTETDHFFGPLPQTPPTPEEMGHCDSVYLDEVGDTQVVVFKHEKEDGAISTLVIRGSTDNRMDDIERAIDDGVNTFKVLVRDKRLVPGAGATEIELARQITSYGESCPGLEQYAIKKFAEAFEAVPRALAENSGIKGNELISKLYAVHHEGNKNMGFDIEGEGAALKDMLEAGILEPFLVKHWGIKLATNAAITVLRVDQIIMAKPAGGPRAPKQQGHWDKDEGDEPEHFDTHH